jgi:hypothetical protein
LNFILATNAAALLILVKKSRCLSLDDGAAAAHPANASQGLKSSETVLCLICVTPPGRDLRSPDSRIGRGVFFRALLQPRRIALMIRNKPLRRSLGALFVLLGALLIWLPYDLASGVVLMLAGAALELLGITLEKSDKQTNSP